jgi:hypothetical protein
MTAGSALQDLFDTYSRRARLQPALLALFPLLAIVAALFPQLYTMASGLLGLAVASGAAYWLAEYARARGRAVERRLREKWGGKPTSAWLRHADRKLDPGTKARYCAFLERTVPNWRAPTEAEEKLDPKRADDRYDEAVIWLIEFTRDNKRFPLVFKENVLYGFRRNMLGLRPFGISVSGACMLIVVTSLLRSGVTLAALNATHVAAFALAVLALCAWLTTVSEEWVCDAAQCYARALLATCNDAEGTLAPPSSKAPRKVAQPKVKKEKTDA